MENRTEVQLSTANYCGRISAVCDLLRKRVHGPEARKLIDKISILEKKIMNNEVERLRKSIKS